MSRLVFWALLCLGPMAVSAVEPPQTFECLDERNRATTRVVGGQSVRIEDYPWQVSLTLEGEHNCGASIIAPSWLLTAAHCFMVKDRGRIYDFSRGEAFALNGMRYGGTGVGSGRSQAIKKIYLHPEWSGELDEGNDIALVRLAQPLPMQRRQMVQIANPNLDRLFAGDGRCSAVSGWGKVREGGRGASSLQAVELPIVPLQVCKKTYGWVGSAQICAGYDTGGKDSCQGDSGGPMVVAGGPSGYIQVGVVSGGFGCARPGVPGVYTRVSAYADWIVSTTQKDP